jgi:hypothetical protein
LNKSVHNTVDELARVARAEFVGDLDRLVDDYPGRDLRAVEHLRHGRPKDVLIDQGDAFEVPVGSALGDSRVESVLVVGHQRQQRPGIVGRVVTRVPVPDLVLQNVRRVPVGEFRLVENL